MKFFTTFCFVFAMGLLAGCLAATTTNQKFQVSMS
jgi:hypothetical protein